MFILRSIATATSLAFLFVVSASVHGQARYSSDTAEIRPVAQTASQRQPAPRAQPSPQLWKLLSDWEAGSAKIKTLEGRHQRRIYDDTFKVEKLADGEFWYAGPDKGRIDIKKIKITPKMLADRNNPQAKVERDADGKPYTLKSDDERRWVCDGVKLFDIVDERKEALITNLPPENRGENIMNTPLPFLFGMPPKQALERYDIEINNINTTAKPNFALLTIHPRLALDARNWKKAQVYLNLENYLPMAVKLIDPAGTKRTVYSFFEPKINRRLNWPLGQKWWEPNLRGYQVNVTETGAPKEVAGNPKPRANGVPVLPNVVGIPHDQAVKLLVVAGVPEGNIRKLKAGPAPQERQKYRVSRQNPAKGAPVSAKTRVELFIFTEPDPSSTARGAARTPR